MQLNLSNEEVTTLRDVLHDLLPDLKREFARTDLASREMRHELEKRVRLSERLLAELSQSSPATSAAAR
jgi:hypothetical protein